jgi:hypothetical protein
MCPSGAYMCQKGSSGLVRDLRPEAKPEHKHTLGALTAPTVCLCPGFALETGGPGPAQTTPMTHISAKRAHRQTELLGPVSGRFWPERTDQHLGPSCPGLRPGHLGTGSWPFALDVGAAWAPRENMFLIVFLGSKIPSKAPPRGLGIDP